MGWGDLRPYFFTLCHGASAGEGLEGEAVWDRKPRVGPESTPDVHLGSPIMGCPSPPRFGVQKSLMAPSPASPLTAHPRKQVWRGGRGVR